jgi:DNA-binding NarL/FixJ family response regulator
MKDPVIFIVDTNLVHGNLIKYQMSARKFNNVWLFTSVEECLYRIRKQPPDFLITEYALGNYRGTDLLRMTRKISPKTSVLFFTSVEDAGLAKALLAEGARDYIVKSGRLESSIAELIRNMEFLFSEIPSNQD